MWRIVPEEHLTVLWRPRPGRAVCHNVAVLAGAGCLNIKYVLAQIDEVDALEERHCFRLRAVCEYAVEGPDPPDETPDLPVSFQYISHPRSRRADRVFVALCCFAQFGAELVCKGSLAIVEARVELSQYVRLRSLKAAVHQRVLRGGVACAGLEVYIFLCTMYRILLVFLRRLFR